MAKIRVYELARELNMTNKALIEKMSDMDIAVKSHMSSLEDEAVTQIKAAFFGKPAEKVEETRIKPTVIRRRRKKVVEPAEVEAVQEEDSEEGPEPATAEALVEEADENAPTVPEVAEAEAEKVPVKKGTKAEEPAKIVKRPPEKEIAPQAVETATEPSEKEGRY